MQINDTTVEVVRGSVTDQDVDAIVNAANTQMRGGGGIDGRIHRLAGKGLMEELARVAIHGAKTGTAVITGGHDLKQKHIIHTPGPYWNGGRNQERETLARCYRSCMDLAASNDLASIAFCSIATGVYRFPLALAAPIAVGTVIDYIKANPNTSITKVVFAMYGADEYEAFTNAVESVVAQ